MNAPPIERPVIPARDSAPAKPTSGRRQAAGLIDASPSEINPPPPNPEDYGASANSQINMRESGLIGAICDEDIPAEKALSRGENDADGPPDMFGPRAYGFDMEELNREFALVLLGSKALVFREQPDAPIADQQRILGLEAFHAWFDNRFTEQAGPDGKVKRVTWAKAWRTSKGRRQYSGVEFHPDPDNKPGAPGYLNLWSGFAVEPAPVPEASRYGIFRDHLLNNVCSGDVERFKWVFGFFAHIVQRPRERYGVALVLRGRMGTGKTKVGEVMGSLYPRHYFLVDDPRYVTGNFNTHMASCLLLQADEAVWAGDKAAEGRLKGLITAPMQQIEAKGVDAVPLKNYVRLVMTSNEEWVVPAGKDERRFTVLDVEAHSAQNHQYFREMDEQLANGGLAHLLGDLLAFNLDSINLRKVLRTEALLEQKIRSLNSVESWWYERLQSGAIFRNGQPWPKEVLTAPLFDDYIMTAEKIGIKRKQEEAVFGLTLKKMMPGLDKRRATQHEFEGEAKRPWVYKLPSIEEARAHFESLVGQHVKWAVLDNEAPREVDAIDF